MSFVFVPRRRVSGGAGLRRGNYELENYTESLYNAREQAMERMQSAAIELGGTAHHRDRGQGGADGLSPTTHSRSSRSGTATRLEAGAHLPHLPKLAITLDDVDPAFEARSLRDA